MKDIVKYCNDTIKETGALIHSTKASLKQNIEKEEYRKTEEVIPQNEETTKRTLKQRKFKKFNYLKYKHANDKTLQPNETVVQQDNSKLSYTNALKQNVNYEPPTDNTTDWTSERPTLQQQLKSFSTKHTKRDRSRSPSREQSTAKSNDQPRDQEIGKLKAEIEKLKQINQTGNTNMDHTHQNPQKIQTERKVQGSSKNGATASETWGQREKLQIPSVISFIEDKMRTYGERLKNQLDISDLEGIVVNLTAFSFSKSEYKLLNINLNFIPTPKVYNKNKLDNDLNNFFRLIKLKPHFKDSVN